jgi:ATP-binding cassette, subfamily B (MDR/TAP), member 10
VLGVLLVGYLVEPLLTRVYMVNTIAAGEKVLATLRMELFRTLLMQKIEFFDTHSAAALQGLISVELDSIRTFIFKYVVGWWASVRACVCACVGLGTG